MCIKMSWFDSLFRRKRKTVFMDLSGKSMTDEEYNRIRRQQEAYAMRLLEKVGKHGKGSLDTDEKAFLEEYSRSNYID